MIRTRSWLVGLALVVVLGMLLGLAPRGTVRAQEGPNLLNNGDMESGCGSGWPFQDGIPEVQVAPGWRGFWIDNPPPSYAVRPAWCEEDPGCVYWGRPEFRGIMPWQDSLRVHGGNCAQKLHSFARQMEAGLYQQVGGIAPNTRLRFQAYVQTWSCMGTPDHWNVCPTAPYSNSPAPMHVRVGIDPTGGTNPWAGTVVWSGEENAWDAWTLFQVEAVAQAETVTVFVYHRTDWTDGVYRPNNDVYIDDASLVAVGEGPAPTPPPASQPVAPAPVVPVAPRPTSTPRPDGAIVHVVQSGDTVMGIAIEYGVPMDQLLQLNAGSIGAGYMIWPGQELVISIPAGAVAPVVPSAPMTATVPAEVAMTGAAICIVAFNDRNSDTFREPDSEEMLPNATFILGETSRGVVGQYTTDGLSEPYCFQGLAAGTYRIVMQPPSGYASSGPSEMMLGLSTGSRLDVALGAQRSGSADASADPDEAAEDAEGSAAGSRGLHLGVGIVGILMLVAATAMAVLFVLSRRR